MKNQTKNKTHFWHVFPFHFFILGLGGCIRALTIQSDETNRPISQTIDLSLASRHSLGVYLDGCPTSESRYNCRGNDSVLVYSGRMTQATDSNLQPFSGNDVYSFVQIFGHVFIHTPLKNYWGAVIPWMVKNDSGRHFFHMSHKILNDVSRLSFCV